RGRRRDPRPRQTRRLPQGRRPRPRRKNLPRAPAHRRPRPPAHLPPLRRRTRPRLPSAQTPGRFPTHRRTGPRRLHRHRRNPRRRRPPTRPAQVARRHPPHPSATLNPARAMTPPAAVTPPPGAAPCASRAGVTGNLLGRLNTTFAAGLRGVGIYTRTDRQDPVYSPGSAPGSRALALQPDQALVSEMMAVGPGRHTLGLDLRGTPGARVTARVASSWQTPDGELHRPVLGEASVELASENWIRLAVPVHIPDDCPGINLQIGEQQALRDVFSSDAPGWSTRPAGDAPVVHLDRLSLRRGEASDYTPPASVELGLDSPASAWLAATADTDLPLSLTVANPGDTAVTVRLAGRAGDILYGTAHPLPLPETLSLGPGEARAVPFSLSLPAGQFVVAITADTG